MRPIILGLWNSRPFRFLLVGGTATLLHMFLLMFFVEMDIMRPVVASAASYVISAFYNYTANFHFTFGASALKRHSETAPKFLLVSTIGVTVNTLIFAVVNHLLSFYIISQVIAIIVTLLVNYTLHKYWIYRS
jgi:putative flippase GtrA